MDVFHCEKDMVLGARAKYYGLNVFSKIHVFETRSPVQQCWEMGSNQGTVTGSGE